MRAIHEDGAARTAFTLRAESPEREAQLAALMGAETDEEPLEAGDLGHQGHAPIDEQLYCAAGWESDHSTEHSTEHSAPELCPEPDLQLA